MEIVISVTLANDRKLNTKKKKMCLNFMETCSKMQRDALVGGVPHATRESQA